MSNKTRPGRNGRYPCVANKGCLVRCLKTKRTKVGIKAGRLQIRRRTGIRKGAR